MRGKYLNTFGEYTERICAYKENTPREIKVCTSPLIIIQIQIYFRFFLTTIYGTD